jgi:hypothetical protein
MLNYFDVIRYGKGTYSVTTNGTGSAAITLTINTAQSYGAPTIGMTMYLRAWMVTTEVFNLNNQPWVSELDREEVTATVGTVNGASSVTYSTPVIIVLATLMAFVRNMF